MKSDSDNSGLGDLRPPIALLADIHGNLEALDAVLKDIDRRKIRTLVSMGDAIGYGADPEKVLDRLMARNAIAVAGNHDSDVVHGGYEVNSLAREALEFTRERLMPKPQQKSRTRLRRWHFLESFPPLLRKGELCFVHGSPRQPFDEYIYGMKDPYYDPDQLRELFPMVKWICFCGHTHKPCIIREDHTCWYPDDEDFVHQLGRYRRYFINVGSVGQPRDGDPRAGYVIFDGESAEFRRIEYNVKKAMAKIRKIGPLSKKFSERLIRGI